MSEDSKLMAAVKRLNLGGVENVLAEGVAINEQDDEGATALMHACLNGHYRIAKLLIENGADVQLKDNDSAAAITWAAWGGAGDVMQLLIKNGANLEEKDKEGFTPLMGVAEGGRPPARYREAVRTLLSLGASLETRNNHGETALDVAARAGNPETLRILEAARVERREAAEAAQQALVQTRQAQLRTRAKPMRPGGPA